jgi:hypothetical protein
MTYVDPRRPTPPEVEAVAEVRKAEARSNTTAWWVAGLVAVVAIGAVAFMVTSTNSPNADQLNAQADAARAQGVAEGLTQGVQQGAAQAQVNSQAALQSQSAAQTAQVLAAQSEADRAAAARARAEAAAAQAQIRGATEAGRDASATVPDEAPPQQ